MTPQERIYALESEISVLAQALARAIDERDRLLSKTTTQQKQARFDSQDYDLRPLGWW